MKSTIHRIAVLLLIALSGRAIGDEPARNDADLAFVPADAQLFGAVRVADFLATDQARKVMPDLMKLSGDKMVHPLLKLQEFEKQLAMKLDDVERVLIVATDVSKKEFWVAVRTKKDFDKEKVLAALGKPEEKTVKGKTYWLNATEDAAFHLAGPRLAVIASNSGMERCLGLGAGKIPPGPLADAVKAAAGDRYHFAITVDLWNALPVDAHEALTNATRGSGPDAALADLYLSARSLSYTARYGKKLEIELTAGFRHSTAAERAIAQLESALAEIRKQPQHADDDAPERAVLLRVLDKIKPVQSGSSVTAKAPMDEDVLFGTYLPAVQRVQAIESYEQAQRSFRRISRAFEEYEEEHDSRIVPASICNQDGKPMLSWRVALLPHMGQNELFRQFKLDEPWDGPNNSKLLGKMPKHFECAHMPAAKEGHTYMQVVIGDGTLFRADTLTPRFTMETLPDGRSQQILVATGARSVPWTKPDDIVMDKDALKPKLGFGVRGSIVVLADGSIRTLQPSMTEKTLRWAIQPDDGNALGDDWHKNLGREERYRDREKRGYKEKIKE